MMSQTFLFLQQNRKTRRKISHLKPTQSNMNIFCDTAMAYGPSDIIHTYGIYGETADEWEEGEQLYQKFKIDFFNGPGIEDDPETEGKG